MLVLVVGIGNPLRRDDGIGRRIAEEIGAVPLPGVTIRSQQQLTPELAETMSLFDHVIVVDASTEIPAGRIHVGGVEQNATPLEGSHACDLSTLAAIAETLYRRRPRFTSVAIGAGDLGIGAGLSLAVQSALPDALRAIRHLCRES